MRLILRHERFFRRWLYRGHWSVLHLPVWRALGSSRRHTLGCFVPTYHILEVSSRWTECPFKRIAQKSVKNHTENVQGAIHLFAKRENAAVGAAFITPAVRVPPGWQKRHGGRDEGCPYRRTLAANK